jgi:hypothetical protein
VGNPISLEEIDCDTSGLLVMSQAPAITKEDAREFYKTNNAFDYEGKPRDYRGYPLSPREMQSLIEQNIFVEPIMECKLPLYPKLETGHPERIQRFSGLSESLGEKLGTVLMWFAFF